jgi:superfamily II RNA helicase
MTDQKLSPYLSIFTEKVCTNIIPEEEIAYQFPYELDAFQKEGIYRIYKNENILITAHTGSGKTVLAIYAIAHCNKMNKKIIYTSPTKSLSNQKYAEFREKFDSVGIMTGDIKMNPDAQCIIMTTEILRNILYKGACSTNSLINIADVGSVIFDEVHYINDPDRGKIWEESIILLPKDISLVMLSATIDKAEQFASWIGNSRERPISLIPTSHRVVPLKHYFWKSYVFDDNGKDRLRWELLEILDEKGTFKNYDLLRKNYQVYEINKLMDGIIDFLVNHNYTPALFFKFSRKKCEDMCKMVRKNLLTHEEISEVEHLFDYYMKDYKSTYEILPQYQDILKQLKKGVVYHHSGLLPILKEIIEILYGKGLVKILFATETFSIGVNMPTKTVLFSDLEKYDNKGLRELRTDEYLQMSGRAGRRGLDKFGSVILLPTMKYLSELSMKNMLTGKSPMVKSKFKLSYQFVLKTLINNDFDVDSFLQKTLIMTENNKQIILYDSQKKKIETEIEEINGECQNVKEEDMKLIKQYEEINKKLNDTFFSLKPKDRIKYENERKKIQSNPIFIKNYEKIKMENQLKEKMEKIENDIWWCDNELKNNIDIIVKVLEEEKYIQNNKITIKGIIASSINECNELIFTEIIVRGLLDDLDFPEIIAVLSSFINEKDQNVGDKFINKLNIPKKVIHVLHEISKISEYFMNMEERNSLYIGTDYNMYLDFIEPSYIWANGGTINEVFQYTFIYDGNFVKSIMRIANICENVIEICKTIERYDLCSKMENYNQILIRDITTINSLYVK